MIKKNIKNFIAEKLIYEYVPKTSILMTTKIVGSMRSSHHRLKVNCRIGVILLKFVIDHTLDNMFLLSKFD